MIKNIFAFADLHIRNHQYHDVYKEQSKKMLLEIQKLIKSSGTKYEENRIVFAGDWNHQKVNISPELMSIGGKLLRHLVKLAPVKFILGNHDLLENNQDRMDSVTPIVELINEKNIEIFYESKCSIDDNVIWCPYAIKEENKRPNIEDYKDDNRTKIGIFHGPIDGLKTDLKYKIESDIDANHFDGLDYTICGDIHKRHVLYNKEKNPVIMIGSLIQQNYGESVDKHGFLHINLETKKYEFHDIENENNFVTLTIDNIEKFLNG